MQRLANAPGVPGGDGSIPPWMRPTTSSSGRSLPRFRATPIGPGHALWYYSWQTLWLQAKHPKRRNKEVHRAFRHKHFKHYRPHRRPRLSQAEEPGWRGAPIGLSVPR